MHVNSLNRNQLFKQKPSVSKRPQFTWPCHVDNAVPELRCLCCLPVHVFVITVTHRSAEAVLTAADWYRSDITKLLISSDFPTDVAATILWHMRVEFICLSTQLSQTFRLSVALLWTLSNKNPSAWNLSPQPEVTCGTVAIIIRVVLLSPYWRIHGVALSSIHYNQSHRVYIYRKQQYICLIWN